MTGEEKGAFFLPLAKLTKDGTENGDPLFADSEVEVITAAYNKTRVGKYRPVYKEHINPYFILDALEELAVNPDAVAVIDKIRQAYPSMGKKFDYDPAVPKWIGHFLPYILMQGGVMAAIYDNPFNATRLADLTTNDAALLTTEEDRHVKNAFMHLMGESDPRVALSVTDVIMQFDSLNAYPDVAPVLKKITEAFPSVAEDASRYAKDSAALPDIARAHDIPVPGDSILLDPRHMLQSGRAERSAGLRGKRGIEEIGHG